MSSRRVFLKNSGLAMVGLGSVPTWLTRAVFAKDAPGQRKKVLIAIFQRGAVDGLNVVVPHGESAYYAMRPSIAIRRPNGTEDAVIDLDGHFGLHPALRSLKPLWDEKHLAIVEAVGSPDPTRSHFDAQDYMESGTPGLKATSDGWLNRALRHEVTPSALRAVSIGSDLPRSLRGRNEALALSSISDFQLKDARAASVFESLYGASADRILNGTARETFEAVRMMQSIHKKPYSPANNAEYPNGRLGQSLVQIARIIKADVALEVAFTDVGGWDTHVNEVGPQPHTGQLANLLRDFGESIAAFSRDMGDRMDDITVVTMSEFGRTARENGNRGTDHGHANIMFVLGGQVRGGCVHGTWPGLATEQLYEGRDLNVTTDFRAVLSQVVATQLGNGELATVFPGFRPGAETADRLRLFA
ncbi:MAG: DUF1501 domain-containing protein [Bryobacteraceae bacterium]